MLMLLFFFPLQFLCSYTYTPLSNFDFSSNIISNKCINFHISPVRQIQIYLTVLQIGIYRTDYNIKKPPLCKGHPRVASLGLRPIHLQVPRNEAEGLHNKYLCACDSYSERHAQTCVGVTIPQSLRDSCSPQTAHPLSLRDIPLTGGPFTQGGLFY